MKHILIAILVVLLSATNSFAGKPWYILEMMNVSESDKTMIQSYEAELKEMAQQYNGTMLLPRLSVEEEIRYENSPENIVPFSYSYFFIIKFDSKKDAKKMAKDPTLLKGKKYFRDHTMVLTKKMKGLPTIPEFPEISAADLSKKPSFVLFNPFSMKKNPFKMMKMLKYFRKVTPKVSEVGTTFYSAFKKKKVLKGEFNFDVLFLTTWKDMKAFEKIHFSQHFSDNVHLRNKALKSLGEAKGILEN